MRAGSNWRHLNGLSLGMMGDPVRCLPKVVHPDVAALKLQHNLSEYRRSGGIEPTRPRGGKGAPAGGTGGGKDGQHTEVGSRLHVTTTDSRTGQISLGDGGGHRLASWTSGYATARSEAICRGAGCGRTRTSGSVGGQGQQRPWSTRRAPGMARSALSGAVNRTAKADREVT